MSDSVSGAVAPGVELVAAYATGFPGSQVAFKTHPSLRHVLIVQANAYVKATVCDVESGAATPAFSAAWARYMRATRQNDYPTVYVQASGSQSIIDAFNAIREPLPFFWLADWDGSPAAYLTNNVIPGPGDVVAHQYFGGVNVSWDLSGVVRYWPGVDVMPYHPPSPLMDNAQWVWIRYTYIPDHFTTLADREHAWAELSAAPAKAKALVLKYAPPNIR